jgi:hypothetical protein
VVKEKFEQVQNREVSDMLLSFLVITFGVQRGTPKSFGVQRGTPKS